VDEGGEAGVPAFAPSPDCVAHDVGKSSKVPRIVLVEELEEVPDRGRDGRGYPEINEGSLLDVIEF